MADPGTIQLTKSGVTFITALVMIATLNTKISKIQWIAILMQVSGTKLGTKCWIWSLTRSRFAV